MTAKTILCVDDDKQIRELLQTYLGGKGYQVITSADGWDCLREIVIKRPDLILLDVNMPKLDGMNALDMIKVTLPDHHIPVILVSGEGDRETILKAAQLGADDFVVKPFSFEDLETRIAIQLYTLDFPRLQKLLTSAPLRHTSQVPGLDLEKYRDWNAYTCQENNIDLCVLLPHAVTPDQAATLAKGQANQQIMVLKKTPSHWKCVWPHASHVQAASAA